VPNALRLALLGSIGPQAQPTVYAEFGNARAVAHPSMPAADFTDLIKRMGDLRSYVESGYPPAFNGIALARLGSKLFDLIVCDSVRTLYTGTAGARAGGFIALELLTEDPALAAWPWEYLYDATSKNFLCQEFYPISRVPFMGDPGAITPAAPRKTRLLVVMGAPDPKLSLDEEVASIRERFASFVATDAIELEVLRDASPAQFQRRLDAGVDLIHFLGHAGFDARASEGFLQMPGASGKPFNLSATPLAQLLGGRGVRVVFLNACETASGTDAANVGRNSVAGALLERGIPTVIATQFSMPDNTAHFFAAETYNALAHGKPVVEAVRGGRLAMQFGEQASFCDWGIPVLYSSQPDLVLFPAGTAARAAEATAELATRAQPHRSGGPSIAVERTITTMRDGAVDLAVDGVGNGGTIAIDVSASTRRAARKTRKTGARAAEAHARVALVDIDAQVGFLPDLVVAANGAQSFWDFRVVYLPIPTGAVRRDLGGPDFEPQLFLPRLDEYLAKTPTTLGVEVVCCLTGELLAGTEADGSTFFNYYASPIDANHHVVVISTNGLRQRAKRAGVSFAKAALFLSLGQLLIAEGRWGVGYHEETKGCLFDFNRDLDGLIVGLKHMRFDHAPCRALITDAAQLAAIDALLKVGAKAS